MYITIVHANQYLGLESFMPGQNFKLELDPNNYYDEETIIVKTMDGVKCGHVANSTCSVARGTHSAGYVNNLINKDSECKILFIIDDKIIAEII